VRGGAGQRFCCHREWAIIQKIYNHPQEALENYQLAVMAGGEGGGRSAIDVGGQNELAKMLENIEFKSNSILSKIGVGILKDKVRIQPQIKRRSLWQ
jgi:uncharacterized protein (UPF0248 family)